MREGVSGPLIGRAAVLWQCGQWQCLKVLAVSGPEGVNRFCGLHAAVSAVIGRSESGAIGSVVAVSGGPRGRGSTNQKPGIPLAHRTTAAVWIYSVLAVSAVVPPSHSFSRVEVVFYIPHPQTQLQKVDRMGKAPFWGSSVRRVLQNGCQVAALCRFESDKLSGLPIRRAQPVSPRSAPRPRSPAPAPRRIRRWRRPLPRPHRPRIAVAVVRIAAAESSASAFTRPPRRGTAVAWKGRRCNARGPKRPRPRRIARGTVRDPGCRGTDGCAVSSRAAGPRTAGAASLRRACAR
jgi:hypothetical protein